VKFKECGGEIATVYSNAIVRQDPSDCFYMNDDQYIKLRDHIKIRLVSGDLVSSNITCIAINTNHFNHERYGGSVELEFIDEGINGVVCFDEMSEFTKEQSDYLINRKLK